MNTVVGTTCKVGHPDIVPDPNPCLAPMVAVLVLPLDNLLPVCERHLAAFNRGAS